MNLRFARTFLVLTASIVVVTLGVVWFLRSSDSAATAERPLPKPEACSVVSNVLEVISRVFAPDGDSLRLDVRKLSCGDFHEVLKGVNPRAVLWTPGEGDWIIVGARQGAKMSLSDCLDRFAEVDTAFSLPEVFANYVGPVADVLPAFDSLDPAVGVAPELFVTRELPSFDSLDVSGIENDFAERLMADIRSLQEVRRMVLGGNFYARKGDRENSARVWSAAYQRNHFDTLLMERILCLRANAEVFFSIGKYGMAGNCYETLIGINPKDVMAMKRLAVCFRHLGDRKTAALIERRIRELDGK